MNTAANVVETIALILFLILTLKNGTKIMSAVTDATTKIQANLDATKAGVANLDAKIVALAAQLSSSGLSDADKAALQSVVDASAALASAAQVDPTAPPAPPAPVTPAT